MTSLAVPWIAALFMTAAGLLVLMSYGRFSSRHFSYPANFSRLCRRAGIAPAVDELSAPAKNAAVIICNRCDRRESCNEWLERGIEETGYRRFCPNAGFVDWLAERLASEKAPPDLRMLSGTLSHPSANLPPFG